jgi:hypothetical protein
MDEKTRLGRAAASSSPAPVSVEERDFIEALVANGQAAELDAQGRLPKGATHEITGYWPDGLPKVIRRRMTG